MEGVEHNDNIISEDIGNSNTNPDNVYLIILIHSIEKYN